VVASPVVVVSAVVDDDDAEVDVVPTEVDVAVEVDVDVVPASVTPPLVGLASVVVELCPASVPELPEVPPSVVAGSPPQANRIGTSDSARRSMSRADRPVPALSSVTCPAGHLIPVATVHRLAPAPRRSRGPAWLAGVIAAPGTTGLCAALSLLCASRCGGPRARAIVRASAPRLGLAA